MSRILTLFVVAILAAGPAASHSSKELVTPEEGAVVAGSPPEIRMEFDGAMRITRITLTDGAGKAHALERTDRMAPVTTFVATPTALPAGDYKVEWRGISTDGHTMDGGWSFSVK